MLYRVERPNHPSAIFPAIEMVDAASAKVGTSGTLTFFDEMDNLLRAFAHGQWATVTVTPDHTADEIIQTDLYAEATKDASSGF